MIFEFIGILFGILLAIIGSLTFWPISHFYDFYRPLVLLLGGYISSILLMWGAFTLLGKVIVSNKKEYTKPDKFARNLLTDLLAFICFHARIKLTIKGKNKVPLKGRFLLVCNHKSKFDPMIITSIYGKRDIAFLTKRANMKIPLGGRLMRKICYLPLDREDKLQSLEQMKKAETLIVNNYSSVGVFPEGKRYDEDVVLGDFHEGVFNIALRAKCPILVATFKGTSKIHKNFPFKRTKVLLNFLDLIPYDQISNKTAKQLSDEIHEIMYNNLVK